MIRGDVGIAAFGAYIPQLRVSRAEIAAAHSWMNPALKAYAQSERSVCSWDEDALTMAVEAARDCLEGTNRSDIGSLYLASTTTPFADRLNAGVVAGALALQETVFAQDVTGSLRAGMTALLTALDVVNTRETAALCTAADSRAAPAGTADEMSIGHAAAALLVAPGAGVARLLGSASLTVDFVDHFRAQGRKFDYHWEERWVRDEGYLKLVPRLVNDVLQKANTKPEEISHFCVPCPLPRVDKMIAKRVGLAEATVRDSLAAGCGDSGAAHPLLMLVHALEEADPGDKILVVGFGQGGDAAIFEVTSAIEEYRRRRTGVSKWLSRRSTCTYPRYALLSGLLQVDRGIRAEADKGTALTAAYRHRDLTLALIGGRCERCGTLQIPRTRICANPDCRAADSQGPHSFANTPAHVASWSADSLTYTPDPPAYYGMIDFEGGGRLMMDFTNVVPGGVQVGTPVRMVFRVKDHDALRGFARYFWKAAPLEREEK